MAIDYGILFKDSWKKLYDNPVLLAPILLRFGFGIIMLGLFLIEGLILYGNFSNLFTSLTTNPKALLGETTLIALVVLFIVIDAVIGSLLFSYTNSMQWGMTKELIYHNKITNIWDHGKKNFIKFFELIWVMFLILMLPFFLIMALLVPGMINLNPLSYILAVIILLIFVLYWTFMGISLIFLPCDLVTKKTRIFPLIKKGINYLFNKPGHVLATWAIVLAMSMGLRMVIQGFAAIPFIGVIFVIIGSLASIVIGVWSIVFIMSSYKKGNL